MAIGAFALVGCAHTIPLGGDPKLNVIDAAELPAPGRTDVVSVGLPYLVGPYDKLTIDVLGIDDLENREVQVDAGGKLSFPIAGATDVAGKTTEEIAALLTEKLRAGHVRDPKVSVNLKEMLSQTFTVDGEVKTPGVYPFNGQLTLMKAVARAQGTTEFSRLDDVVVFRTVNGQRYAALYNLDMIRHGAYADPQIYPNDVVMVGDDNARRLFRDILKVVPALATPIVITIDRLTR